MDAFLATWFFLDRIWETLASPIAQALVPTMAMLPAISCKTIESTATPFGTHVMLTDWRLLKARLSIQTLLHDTYRFNDDVLATGAAYGSNLAQRRLAAGVD